jgi:uncharacterized membrane protein YoaT (DUF817 family)
MFKILFSIAKIKDFLALIHLALTLVLNNLKEDTQVALTIIKVLTVIEFIGETIFKMDFGSNSQPKQKLEDINSELDKFLSK